MVFEVIKEKTVNFPCSAFVMHISYNLLGLSPTELMRVIDFKRFAGEISCNILLCFWHIFSKILRRASTKLLKIFSSLFRDIFSDLYEVGTFLRNVMMVVPSKRRESITLLLGVPNRKT